MKLNKIKRYDPNHCTDMHEDKHGLYVLYSNFESMVLKYEAKIKILQRKLAITKRYADDLTNGAEKK
jgi:hypothetical protein